MQKSTNRSRFDTADSNKWVHLMRCSKTRRTISITVCHFIQIYCVFRLIWVSHSMQTQLYSMSIYLLSRYLGYGSCSASHLYWTVQKAIPFWMNGTIPWRRQRQTQTETIKMNDWLPSSTNKNIHFSYTNSPVLVVVKCSANRTKKKHFDIG